MYNLDEYDPQDFFPQSEAQNCLFEARLSIALMDAPTYTGEGPFSVEVRDAVYCRATDAFAGTHLSAVHYFATREAAEAWADEQHEQGCDDTSYTILPHLPRYADALTHPSTEECPF